MVEHGRTCDDPPMWRHRTDADVAGLRAQLEQLDAASLRDLVVEVSPELEPAAYARFGTWLDGGR